MVQREGSQWREDSRIGRLVSCCLLLFDQLVSDKIRIFAVFNLQEVMTLAHRSDGDESLITTLALTTDLKVTSEGKEDEEPSRGSPSDRALIM